MCHIKFFGITNLHVEAQGIESVLCLSQVYDCNATSEYEAFVDELNDALLRVPPTEFTVLTGILTHMLEQTQIRGRL